MSNQLYSTLRAALEATLGQSVYKVRDAQELILSEDRGAPMEGAWHGGRAVLTETGVPFVVCGGEVVLAWYRERGSTGAVYLVRESMAYDDWMRRRWLDMHQGTITATGSAPSVYYRLVRSL